MPPRKLTLLRLLIFVPALLAAIAACGGDDDDDTTFQPGRLTDPEEAPTSTPWAGDKAPEVVVLDPNNISPLPPDNPGNPEPEPTVAPEPGEPGVCGETYTVEAGDLLVTIGEKCGVPWEEIAALNPEVDANALTVGEVLIMPAADSGEGEEGGDNGEEGGEGGEDGTQEETE
ncbi:MAG TPA: LysM domain-containing protein [Dehalococcoidia bacterium]|nr:LysM domain-containing protein [Dehalococcoidia bacterium]